MKLWKLVSYMHHTPWLLLLTLSIVMLSVSAGCSRFTMDDERSKRISSCLARCQEISPSPAIPAGQGPNEPNRLLPDQRTDCERQCHSLN